MQINKKILTIIYSTIITSTICTSLLTDLDFNSVMAFGIGLLMFVLVALDNKTFKNLF